MGLTNKCHEVTKRVSISVTNIFCWLFYYLLLIYIIFFYIDIYSLMMLWRTFEECRYRVCAVLAFRLSLLSYYRKLELYKLVVKKKRCSRRVFGTHQFYYNQYQYLPHYIYKNVAKTYYDSHPLTTEIWNGLQCLEEIVNNNRKAIMGTNVCGHVKRI